MARAHYAVGAPTAVVLSVAPVADLIIWLWLLIAAEIAVCLMLAREWQTRPNAAETAANDLAASYPMRRIVPHLRARQPPRAAEAQLAWRRAVPARRHRRTAPRS